MGEAETKSKEERVRAITRVYYSRPDIQKVLLEFAQDRELVPRYFEGFGKRPDMLQYPSDIMGLVGKGATSFHGSEEHWVDPLSLSVDLTPAQISGLRKGWDLLIDIDSPFLDCSRIAAQLIIAALEHHGIKHYGIKFSGSKGFHLIVPWKAFPSVYAGQETRTMFPEWPRIISEYLMHYIRHDYNTRAAEVLTNISAISERTKLTAEDLLEVYCLQCTKPAQEDKVHLLRCPVCSMEMERKHVATVHRKLRCVAPKCAGVFEVVSSTPYYFCETCKDPLYPTQPLDSNRHPTLFDAQKRVSAAKVAALDMVLVAPRHLFRAPYSLHEKTSLASCVLTKEELDTFSPQDARPLSLVPRTYIPSCNPEEGKGLLMRALQWKQDTQSIKEKQPKRPLTAQERVALTGVTEEMFPPTIQKLRTMKMEDGKKRGLFVLITFLRACGFGEAYITEQVHAWNAQHPSPLRQAYVKAQLEWHFKQKKLILPPNYENVAFYRDLGILEGKPTVKNPLVEVQAALRR